MGVLATLKNAIFKQTDDAPGKSINVDLQTIGDNSDDAELYHLPGVFSKPIDGTTGVSVDVGGNNIIVSTHDYRLNKDLDKGETLIYSLDSDGVIQGEIFIDNVGKIAIRNDSQSLKSLVDDLIDEVKALTTFGSPTFHQVSAATKANLDVIKSDFDDILRD